MENVKVTAQNFTPRVQQWLQKPAEVTLLHLFDRVINLVDAEGEIISVVQAQIQSGPFSLVVEGERPFPHLITPHAHISRTATGLTIGPLEIEYRQAKLWQPVPDWQQLRKRQDVWQDVLPEMETAVHAHLNTLGSLGPANFSAQFQVATAEMQTIFFAANSDEWRTAVTKLAYHSPDGRVAVFTGQLSGTIAAKPAGQPIFGWDAIFIPTGHERTLAEMSIEQRNTISTRKQAVAEFYTAVLEDEQADTLLQNRIRLRELMVRYFNKAELETLCFDLGIDKDALPNATKPELAQEIILYCERHDKLERLLEICRDQRPHAEWPEEL
ncbi:MAG: non-canonical purine NTP pyrophosphatase [Anaerolineales bacterium]|nr:non-canonical purine NTP pyrophosphatase [Anaerolineales bacterium]